MKEQLGRSLIEVIAVVAIAGVMAAGAIGTYAMIRNNQMRSIASATLQQIASDSKLLMSMRGSYAGISVDYLIKSGALDSSAAPIGGSGWSVTPTLDDGGFSINLVGLSRGECEYFATAPARWATRVVINGYDADAPQCFSSSTNNVSFIVE